MSSQAKVESLPLAKIYLWDQAEKMTAAEETEAPFEDRLRSIWRFLVQEGRRRFQQIPSQDREGLTVEDICQRYVLELKQKDSRWKPESSRYITFAGQVIKHAVADEVRLTRAVPPPANSWSNRKTLRKKEADGVISDQSRVTLGKLEVALRSTIPMGDAQGDILNPEQVELMESVKDCLGQLDDDTAFVLEKSYSIDGNTRWTPRVIANAMGVTLAEVRQIRQGGEEQLRAMLEAPARRFDF